MLRANPNPLSISSVNYVKLVIFTSGGGGIEEKGLKILLYYVDGKGKLVSSS